MLILHITITVNMQQASAKFVGTRQQSTSKNHIQHQNVYDVIDILEYMDQRMHLYVIPAEHSLAEFPTPRSPTNVTREDLVLLT